ncbi:hypothetical protein [Pseudoclavibacter sp. 13-3]|uniref:hypothetical protein n=1 Tax=Pseudoclavibacter sp. 13-3 TaxID=2901228 RepID=UPI001E2F0339|nr:hypothetical protein [Pseudoclavibacter sp. 13-3]MCD7100647.1 hypothetical protein [Pseudoclavibacter sp. 13-3]
MNADSRNPKPRLSASSGPRERGWAGWRLTAWAAGIMLVPLIALLFVPNHEIWTLAWFAYVSPIIAVVFGAIWGRGREHPSELWQMPAAVAVIAAVVVLIFMRPFEVMSATIIVGECFVVGMIGTLVGLGLRKLSGR